MATSASVGVFCTQCGISVEHDDKFCRSCGKALATDVAVPADVPPQVKVESKQDKFLIVRIVLLIAAGVSALTLPWYVTAGIVLVWIIVGVWPHSD